MFSGSGIAVSLFLGYWTFSSVLFYFPHLVHTKKKRTIMAGVKHISHRGGCFEAPENTIAAFRNAIKAGTEMLELDVHLTKDKEVVVFHDESLYRPHWC